ncbi:hypothetical protein EL22_29015 [Halostagnicola sp. A56]|nr:hypothetical protein EL22_29015 [Halostagnicola sp. A56]
MGPITNVETEWILSGKSDWIGPEFAATLSQHPLDSIETEFPHFVRTCSELDFRVVFARTRCSLYLQSVPGC